MSNEKIEYLNLDLLHPFENNPFQSVDAKEYDELRDSVMEFGIITPLIEKIEVHSIEGKGKNKTQRIVIHYRFVGVIENPIKEDNIVLEARQGVAVEYLTA